MKYNIKVYKTKNAEWSTKAYAAVTMGDSFKITGITVRQASNGNLFVAMPNYKTSKTDDQGKPIYKDFCNPTTKEFRDELYSNILDAYKNDEKEVNIGKDDEKLNFDVSLNLMSGSNVEALGRIYFDKKFVVNNVKIMSSEKGSFVAMPSQLVSKGDEGKEYEDVCFPITKEFREELYSAIFGKKAELEQKQNEEFMKVDEALDGVELPFR